MKLLYSPEARTDMRNLKEYISEELYNPAAAKNTIGRILKCCSLLKEQPLMGAKLSLKIGGNSNLYYVVCGNHIIFYYIENDIVYIGRILDGRTDYLRILFGKA